MPAEEQRPTRVRWQLVLILMAFAGLNHFNRQSLPSVVTQVMHDCQFTEIDMGRIYSAFLLGYVILMIPGGWLADRGARFALILSGLGTAALVAATGFCGHGVASGVAFGSFLVVRCAMGALSAPLFPAAGRIVNAWIGFGARAWANGLVLGALTIGISLAPIVFGGLSDLIGWQTSFAVMGAITALVTAVWSWLGRNTPDEHPHVNDAELELTPPSEPITAPRPEGSDLLQVFTNPSLLFLTLNYAAVGYYSYTLFYWMKYYFSDVLKYPEQTSRYFTAIVTFAMTLAMPLGGILSDQLVRRFGYRIGRSALPIFGMLASAVLLFAATCATTPASVVTLFFLAHFSIGLCEAPTWVAALEVGGTNCGTSAAVVNTGGNLGGLLAPAVTPYLAQYLDWSGSFAVASLVCLVGAAQWFGIRLKAPADD